MSSMNRANTSNRGGRPAPQDGWGELLTWSSSIVPERKPSRVRKTRCSRDWPPAWML
jgi:hypothetical protein